MGAPLRHGRELKLADQATCPGPDVVTTTQTSRYGTAAARAWHRAHPRLKARGAWAGHQGTLPVIEGTLIQLTVDHLPHDHHPKPVWLWTSDPAADAAEANRCWQAFLRRFDIEHTFRFLKQALGWTRPRLRDPAAADTWTWLILAALAPAMARPRHRRRPAPALAAPRPARPPDPRPGPPRIPEHPRNTAPPHSRTKTRQARPRAPARLPQPPPGHPP